MCNFFPRGTLAGTDSADVFHGHEQHVPISMSWLHDRPGEVPELHRHPYSEVFVVPAGEARFQVDAAEMFSNRL